MFRRVGPDRTRWELLIQDYELLRADERNSVSVLVTMASVVALVGGTSMFFLLRGCGITHAASCSQYPWQAYALLPAPTVAVCAQLIQLSMTATIRGRLILALEAAMIAERREPYVLGTGDTLLFSSYHAQQPVVHGSRGAALWTMMFLLPFAVVVALVYYSGTQFSGAWAWLFYLGYVGLILVLAWAGAPVFRGYPALDSWIAKQVAVQPAPVGKGPTAGR